MITSLTMTDAFVDGNDPVHEVRVHLNQHDGVRWWAEDDLGFTGGGERLDELIDVIQEWVEAEAVQDRLVLRLVDDDAEPERVERVRRFPAPAAATTNDAGAARVVARDDPNVAELEPRRWPLNGLRAARTAAVFPLSALTVTAAVSRQDLSNALRGLRSRGRCGTVASEAFINGTAANRAAAIGSLLCPAALVRLGAADISDAVRSAAAGAPGWSADAPGWNKRPLSSTTPRARVAAAGAQRSRRTRRSCCGVVVPAGPRRGPRHRNTRLRCERFGVPAACADAARRRRRQRSGRRCGTAT